MPVALNNKNLKFIPKNFGLILPSSKVFDFPEKIISFGTGVLLKGLPYYFVNKANNQGIFKGRILAVKSTAGDTEIEQLKTQDFLYSLQSNGIQNGVEVSETSLQAAISRILHAESSWNEILESAKNIDLQVVLSNTTEIGLNYPEVNDLENFPPKSFPGKLLMFLKARFEVFDGAEDSGMVIIPTELITDNGQVLKAVLLKLATENKLNPVFINWISEKNIFCNSLVDRIVTGKPSESVFEKYKANFGVTDSNLISSEIYRLWAIEGNEKVKQILSFSQTDEGCIITENIDKYSELKLRLLNGSHSLMVGYSFLKGLKTVKESLDSEEVSNFMQQYIFEEIIPTLNIDSTISIPYANQVLDRFRNPNIEHKLLGITVQYSTKMKSRVIPILINYFNKFGKLPENITKGFTYFLKFMKVVKVENDQYFGFANGEFYPIQDINAKYFAEIGLNKSNEAYIDKALKSSELWGEDLSKLVGFKAEILKYFKP